MNRKNELLNQSGIISEEALKKLIEKSTDVSCQCPGQLIHIFKNIQAFTEYQRNCINASAQDEQIHRWLESSSINLEHIVSNIIVTLARMEGMIDDNNEIRKDE